MSLAWIAALIRPEDLAYPVSNDASSEERTVTELAELVRGRSWRSQMHGLTGEDVPDWPSDPVLLEVSNSFDENLISGGVEGLAQAVVDADGTDICRTAAIALLASCAASELDDYETALRVLRVGIGFCDQSDSEDAGLARAFLQQQRALRLRDVGKPHGALLTSVLGFIDALNIDRCEPFPVRSGISGGSSVTIDRMADALHSAAHSLQARELGDPIPPARGVDWDNGMDRLRGESLAGLASRGFQSVGTGSPGPDRMSGPVNPFYYALRWELLGHRRAYEARIDLAHARLTDLGTSSAATPTSVTSAAEVLRLLRHGTEKRDLEIAVRWVKMNGPLDALVGDARKIIEHRTDPASIRVVELHVLRESADLLTPSERSDALASVDRMLDWGGPVDLPRQWEAPALRMERAWLALASLADSAKEIDSVGYRLLDAAKSMDLSDELTDQALGSAIGQLDWPRARESLRQAWVAWLSEKRDVNPRHTTRNLEQCLRIYSTADDYPLQAVAKKIDGVILDIPGDHSLNESDHHIVVDALQATREQAARGMFSFGGLPEADVAAALVVKLGASELWGPLVEYLTDPLVVREHKRAALDRIASASVELPESVALTLSEHANDLLHQPSDHFVQDSTDPFPAALRVLAAHKLISTRSVITLTSDLMEQNDATARREAARTLALLLTRDDEPALLGMTFHLTYDADALVRGYAGSALASSISSDAYWSTIAMDRVTKLLQADGMTAPLAVLQALGEGERIPDPLLPIVERLSVGHVSTRIRRAARQLLHPSE